VTAPDIDDWDQPVAAYTGPERRHLDRTRRAFVAYWYGGYGVTDGFTTVDSPSIGAARDHADSHNRAYGFHVDPMAARREEA
jgi:hypothetical protein